MNQAQTKALGLSKEELSVALCRELGIPPLRTGWRCEDNTGRIWGQFGSREDALGFHQEETRRFGKYAELAGQIVNETVWPSVSCSWELMGTRVLPKMFERGWWLSLKSPFDEGDDFSAGFTPLGTTGWNGRPDFKQRAKDAPEAVARAALLALWKDAE